MNTENPLYLTSLELCSLRATIKLARKAAAEAIEHLGHKTSGSFIVDAYCEPRDIVCAACEALEGRERQVRAYERGLDNLEQLMLQMERRLLGRSNG